MNINKLFQIQAVLDNRIVEEHNLQGVALLDKKILSLQVELGELANEQRSWKFWSKDQEPRIYEEIPKRCEYCRGVGEIGSRTCPKCDGMGELLGYIKNPLLEEYVDCLHFILSIGNDLKATYTDKPIMKYEKWNTTKLFNAMYFQLAIFENDIHNNSSHKNQSNGYVLVFNVFLSIGNRLGFTWEQIEQAYMQKNQINHERQQNGY